ncbi:MAG: leucyl aminopeptidase [Alphaproteobacteria bacterium 16-39-46]|nr:MAG: leucyl aminopeptidase [Alphaproteobacteria bacterium 16-39-46]OZA43632.1 MAG: leucyl aminopeptidase [Alphaproteobacteria bacterium 17-39-52]HQS83793.1 leucyl aminopeptidase [Alphaproteobacteria bacterium]HQS93616.1 leucyl aminopeptidase [Alphaproteobacteria bacterium]
MNIHFTEKASSKGVLVVGIYEDKILTESAQGLDQKSEGLLTRALKNGSFSGKKKEILSLVAPHGLENSTLLLMGLGKKGTLTAQDCEVIGGNLTSHLMTLSQSEACVLLSEIEGRALSLPEIAAHLAGGCLLRSFYFDKYRTQKQDEKKSILKEISFALPSQADAHKATEFFKPLESVSEGVFYTRAFVSEPPNVLYPETFAEELKSLTKLGVKVEILGIEEMHKLGMGALLGVAQGSVKEPKLVLLEWHGKDQTTKPLAFVGKGVTFDTGGISLKTPDGMPDMKYDMTGAATVAGLLKTLALRKARVNVVGVMGLVENMPDGNAQRPSDVVKTMSGQTIEVLNTDAEGRLVLADALWYTQDRFKPELMVDLATLTGAIVISLGNEYAGLFSNNDKLAEELYQAGLDVNEKLWRFPLHENYDKDINSAIADMNNTGSSRKAGSITASQLLARFVNNVPWAHLDIAGVAWSTKDDDLYEKGATGYGVRLLNKFISTYYEK